MRVIFMGTPAFAVPTLQALIDSDHQVVAVYSQPPRPSGRGHKLKNSPVHQLAAENDIEVRTPVSLKEQEIQQAFIDLQADVAVVAAYGLLLPKEILAGVKQGCINIHPSILPRWRGAAPIQRTIMAGDTETGMAIMQMDQGLDTGDILALQTFTLPEDMNAAQLHDQQAALGAEMLSKVLSEIERGVVTRNPQSAEGVTYASKITKAEARLDWNKTGQDLVNQVRGLYPWPAAYFQLDDENIKVLEADFQPESANEAVGTVLDDNLSVQCADGVFQPKIIQRPGKQAADTASVLRGFTVAKGTQLS